MSCRLKREQACTALHNGQRCTRPASELGDLCSAHWRGLSPSARDFLRWEESWADYVDPDPTD